MLLDSETQLIVDRTFRDLTEHVALSLGPEGHTVIIDQGPGRKPLVTKDGVTIAQHYVADTEIGKSVAAIVKEVCQSTDARIGDGTTSTIIFAHTLYRRLRDAISRGDNYNRLMEGVKRAIKLLEKELPNYSSRVKQLADLKQIAYVSSNNDEELAEVIFSAIDKVGEDGSVVVAKSHGTITESVSREGFMFPSGYASYFFVTNVAQRLVDFENPRVLVTNHALRRMSDIQAILAFASVDERPLVIIADTIEDEALAGLTDQNIIGSIRVCAVKAPSVEYGREKEGFFEDVAFFTGAKLVDRSKNMHLSSIQNSVFGQCKIFQSRAHESIIVGAAAPEEAVKAQIAALTLLRDETRSIENEREAEAQFKIFERRINRLSACSATIRVGGNTEAEMMEKKYRVEDAIRAMRSAMTSGTVPGGGVVGLRIGDYLKKALPHQKLNPESKVGYEAVIAACQSIYHHLLLSANLQDEMHMITAKILRKRNLGFGYNVKTRQMEDFRETGIIEPAATFGTIVDNSVAIAKLLLNSNAVLLPPT